MAVIPVMRVEFPDGEVFYSENADLITAMKRATKYLMKKGIPADQRPLTQFTLLHMEEREYIRLGGSQEATDFWEGKI